MRRIHAVPARGYGETLSNLAAGGEASWRRHLAYNLGELTDDDPLLERGVLDRGLQAHLRGLFEHLATRPVRFGLCHGDLSLRNVIVRECVVQVVDWGCAHAHLVPHYDLAVVLAESLDEHTAELAALLDGYGIDRTTFQRDLRADVLALGALEAVDKVRWALDRNRARLPELAGRLDAALHASGIGHHQSASHDAPGSSP